MKTNKKFYSLIITTIMLIRAGSHKEVKTPTDRKSVGDVLFGV